MILNHHIYIDIHSHSFLKVEERVFRLINFIANKDQDVPAGFFSAGIHPWYISGIETMDVKQILLPLIQEERCLAVGECGLDKLRGGSPELQKTIFLEHVQLSEAVKKPLIIHAVKSSGEILQLHSIIKPYMFWIIHGFNNNGHIAMQYLKSGFFLSLSPLFFKRTDATETCRIIPADKFFLETDDSKTDIESLYQQASACMGMPMDALVKIIKENFKNCFLHG